MTTGAGVRTIQMTSFGRDHQPVIVIDNFAADPDMLIDDASILAFRPMGQHYPGVRAVVPPVLVKRLLADIVGLISETFGILVSFEDIDCWYSLVTVQPDELAPIQRLPHFDSADPNRIAVLHYLTRSGQGGTSFFQHRVTELESVDSATQADYTAAIDNDVARYGLPGAGYIAGDTQMFERIAHYKGCFNRAIIYRGNTLHCADIPPDLPLTSNPQSGRLTINTFIHGRPAPAA